MKNYLLLLSCLWLGAGLAHAQDAPSNYQAERDSLWQRAARVRALIDSRIVRSRSSFLALGGTSRRTRGYARGRATTGTDKGPTISLVKKEITKHKTHSADVTKVYYYAISGKLLLAELYQQQQLVRLRLYEYGQRKGRAFNQPFRETEWVRGDYLHLLIRNAGDDKKAASNYFFSAPRPPETGL